MKDTLKHTARMLRVVNGAVQLAIILPSIGKAIAGAASAIRTGRDVVRAVRAGAALVTLRPMR